MKHETIVILDAGPLIHLDELMCLDLLACFPHLSAPQIVWEEALRYRPHLSTQDVPHLTILPNPPLTSPRISRMIVQHDLDEGEAVALTLLEQLQANTFLTDDAAARAAGEALGCKVHGTIGVLIRGYKKGIRTLTETHRLLADIPGRTTLHLKKSLLDKVIAQLPSP